MSFLHKERKVPELNITTENEKFKAVPGYEHGYGVILIDKRANEPLMCYKCHEQEVCRNGSTMKSVKEKGPDTKTVIIIDQIDTTSYFKKLTTKAGEEYNAAMRVGMTPDENGRYQTIDPGPILKKYTDTIGYDEMFDVLKLWMEKIPYDDMYMHATKTSKGANSGSYRTLDGKPVDALKEDGTVLNFKGEKIESAEKEEDGFDEYQNV